MRHAASPWSVTPQEGSPLTKRYCGKTRRYGGAKCSVTNPVQGVTWGKMQRHACVTESVTQALQATGKTPKSYVR